MGVEPELYVLREVNGEWRPFVPDDEFNIPTRGYDLETTIRGPVPRADGQLHQCARLGRNGAVSTRQ